MVSYGSRERKPRLGFPVFGQGCLSTPYSEVSEPIKPLGTEVGILADFRAKIRLFSRLLGVIRAKSATFSISLARDLAKDCEP